SGRGVVAPYFLGVVGKFTRDGMTVGGVIPGTPAARCGLQQGDLIVKIDNQFVGNQQDFFTLLYNSGGTINLVVRRGTTGRPANVEVDLITWELGALGDFTRDGMVIGLVAPGTPADRYGLQRGDVIVRIDNQTVRSQNEFNTLINNSGGSVTLLVRRGGNGQPARLFVDLMNNQLGAWCEPAQEGMRVTAVGPGTPAAGIGLDRGDTILKVDDQRVRSQNDLIAALRESSGFVTLTVRRGDTGKVVRLDVDLGR